MRNGSWVPLVAPGEGTPEAQVALMIKELEGDETKKLIEDAKAWVKKNPKNPLMPQVLLLEGDAEVKRGNKYKSLYSYEELLSNYPTSELYPHVLEREYNVADSLLRGYKRKFLGLRILSAQALSASVARSFRSLRPPATSMNWKEESMRSRDSFKSCMAMTLS